MARVSKRHLLVWFHALTSIGWMSLALCLATLLIFGRSHGDRSAVLMARVLDGQLLQHLATASAFSGFMLSALTPWGYFRYWWVLAKAVISVSQLYVGIFLLSPALEHETWPRPVGALLMLSALAFQAWLSIAKPWRQTPWSSRRRPPTPAGWLYLAALAVPPLDYLLFKAPLLSLLMVLIYPVFRSRALRRSSQTAKAT
jgi:hypothetical protein